MPTLKDVVELLLEMDVPLVHVQLNDALNMVRIMLDEDGCYVIFDNGSTDNRSALTVYAGEEADYVITAVPMRRLYAYLIDGEDTVLKLPYRGKVQGRIEWIPEDADLMEDSPWKRF